MPVLVLVRDHARKQQALFGHAERPVLLLAQLSPGIRRIRMPRIAELSLQRVQRFLHVHEALHDAVMGLNRNDDGRHLRTCRSVPEQFRE